MPMYECGYMLVCRLWAPAAAGCVCEVQGACESWVVCVC